MSVSKRKRSVSITTFTAIVVAVGLLSVFFRKGERKVYVPGEATEGITAVELKPVPKDHPEITFTGCHKGGRHPIHAFFR